MRRYTEMFEEQIKMYVYEEKVGIADRLPAVYRVLNVLGSQIDGRNLTEIINEKHENVKYLPGIELPDNIVAVADAVEAASGADLLIFVLPHQVSGAWASHTSFPLIFPLCSSSQEFARHSKARSARRPMPSL